MPAGDEYLSLGEVVDLLRAAGYPDSRQTVRRAIDRGTYGAEGDAWYRTETGQRKVKRGHVEALIARRQGGQ